MKKTSTLVSILFFTLNAFAQNVGIGTSTPTSRLEVKKPLKSTLKISTAGFNVDTTQLIFSNRDAVNSGTDMLISSNREEGLRFSSNSDLPTQTKDTIMQITPQGNVGIGTATPNDKLEVKGAIQSNGLKVAGTNVLELGYGIISKQTDNGKIGLNVFGEANTLSIVGGGINPIGSDRKIKLWSDGGTSFTGPGSFNGEVSASSLFIKNPAALSPGLTNSIAFGGPGYATSSITTIGTTPTSARMAFNNGYFFPGSITPFQERMTIAANGNVGINNINPQKSLEVNGSTKINGTSQLKGWVQLGLDTGYAPAPVIKTARFTGFTNISSSNVTDVLLGPIDGRAIISVSVHIQTVSDGALIPPYYPFTGLRYTYIVLNNTIQIELLDYPTLLKGKFYYVYVFYIPNPGEVY